MPLTDERQGEPVTIELEGVPPFRFKLHDRLDRFVSNDIRRDLVWEPFETEIVLSFLPRGGTFVDIGANIGWYSVVAGLRVGPGGRVIAFEPEPENHSLLKANLSLNGLTHVEAIRGAVGDRVCVQSLFLSEDNLGDHRLYATDEPREGVEVGVTSLDDFFGESPPAIDAVKMDTQGAEARILAGMQRVLASGANRLRMPLIMEFWPFGLAGAGSSADALSLALESMGLCAWLIDERSASLIPIGWPELRQRGFRDLCPETRAFVNILALPAERPLPQVLEHRVAPPWRQP